MICTASKKLQGSNSRCYNSLQTSHSLPTLHISLQLKWHLKNKLKVNLDDVALVCYCIIGTSSADDALKCSRWAEWVNRDLETSSTEFIIIIIVVVEERKSLHRPWHFSTHDLCSSVDLRRVNRECFKLRIIYPLKIATINQLQRRKFVFSLSEFIFAATRNSCAKKIIAVSWFFPQWLERADKFLAFLVEAFHITELH